MGRATALRVKLNITDLQRLTTSELQDELKKLLTKNDTRVEMKGRPYDALNDKEKKAQNLFGVHLAKFNPESQKPKTKPVNENLPPPKERDVNESKAPAVKTTRVEIFIRPKLSFNGTNPNATQIIKDYLFQLRKADSMIQIHPIDKSNTSHNDVLESEEELPTTQTEMNPWVQNIKINGRRLFFEMKISTIDFDGLKSHIFAWSKGKGHYTDFSKDKQISELFPAGWLHGISARFYNRDYIYEYIISHEPELK